MGELAHSPSKYVLTELTMRSLIELERAKAGMDYEEDVLGDLSIALLGSYDASGTTTSFTFIEPSLYEPYERLVGQFEQTGQPKSARIQSYIKYVSDTLTGVVQGRKEHVAELIPICTTLHRELVQEINAEVALGVNDWPSIDEEPAAGIGTA